MIFIDNLASFQSNKLYNIFKNCPGAAIVISGATET